MPTSPDAFEVYGELSDDAIAALARLLVDLSDDEQKTATACPAEAEHE